MWKEGGRFHVNRIFRNTKEVVRVSTVAANLRCQSLQPYNDTTENAVARNCVDIYRVTL